MFVPRWYPSRRLEPVSYSNSETISVNQKDNDMNYLIGTNAQEFNPMK